MLAVAAYCRGGVREPCAHAAPPPPGTAPCPCQRYDAQRLKYLTFTIVISERQELIMLDNNKARVSVDHVHCDLHLAKIAAVPFTSTYLIMCVYVSHIILSKDKICISHEKTQSLYY